MHLTIFTPFMNPTITVYLSALFISVIVLLPWQNNVYANDNAADTTGKVNEESTLAQYWLTSEQLYRLDPQPINLNEKLSSQCSGMFFKADSVNASSEQATTAETSQEQDTVTADKALYQPDGTTIFEGDVVVNSDKQRITGDYLEFNSDTSDLKVQGGVQIENQGVLIVSENATYNSNTEKSNLSHAEFLLFENGLNGKAESIDISENSTVVKNSSLTSCPPGKESWALKSHSLHLDQEKGWGYATHASLHLAHVPIFYTPYFTFPLNDDRKTGFLYPTIGSDSINGVDIALPYYVNIAPNYDATITPRILSKRGNQIGAEFRYLNVFGVGKISGDYLGQDKINPDFSERKQAQWQHVKQFSPSWIFESDYSYISDSDYFNDIDALSGNATLGFLERKANLSYLKDNAYFGILVQDFQVLDTIDEIDQPFRLAPQVSAGYSSQWNNIKLGLDTQASRFERDISADNLGTATVIAGQLANAELITGDRLVLRPKISADFSSSAYFFKPAIGLHVRQYQLNNYQALNQDQSLDFSVATYSLDSGLIFERPLTLSNQAYTQSLEPRIKLIKTPFQDQSESPDFDASVLSFNSDQVFRDRRYSGNDLVGDTEQVSLGLSSKIFDENQNQQAQFSLAQIVYLEDRQIQLLNTEDTTAQTSPLVGSAQIQMLPSWLFEQSIQWDSEDNRLDQFSSAVQYNNGHRKLANLEFRYRPDNTSAAQKETRASFYWPISSHWTALSFWNFDLNEHSTIELASGLEYENCCVIVKVLNQKWLREISSSDTFESANKQSLEIKLKGLGNLNTQVSDYLRTRIPGFKG